MLHNRILSCLLGLLAAVQPHALAAAAEVPDGFERYDGLKQQFTIAIPQGWSVYNQQELFGGASGPFGQVVFSLEAVSPNLQPGQGDVDLQVTLERLARVDTGEMPSFRLDRLPTKKGMSCDGFDKKAQGDVVKLLDRDPMFGRGHKTTERIHASAVSIGGCKGLRVKGRSRGPDGTVRVLDAFVASDGDVLYLLYLRHMAEYYESNLVLFETAVSTLELSIAAVGDPADGAGASAVRFQWAFGMLEEDSPDPISIDKDMSLQTGDKLEIFLKPLTRCALYLLHQAPCGAISVLYPPKDSADGNPGRPSRPFHLAFELDGHKGFESFFLLASAEPLQTLDRLMIRHAEADSAEKPEVAGEILTEFRRLRKEHRTMRKAAVRPVRIGGVVRGQPDIRSIAKEIAAESFFIKTITIDHQ